MMNKRRWIIAIVLTVLLVPILFIGALLLAVSPERYRDTLITEVSEQSGAKLAINGAIEWQLWPMGIRLDNAVLSDKEGKPLLKAKALSAQLQWVDILKGNSGIEGAEVSGAEIFWNVDKSGHSNWESILKNLAKAEAKSLSRLSLRKTLITWHQEGWAKDISIDAAHIQISNINVPRKMAIDSEFLLSYLDEEGGNLLLQNTVSGRIVQGEKGDWLLRDNRITSIVSSTYMPGQMSVDYQGDIKLALQHVDIPNFKAVLLYRNMSMKQPDQATLSGQLLLEGDSGNIKLSNVAFKSSGSRAMQLAAKGLSANWKTHSVATESLSFSFFDGAQQKFALLPSQAVDFSVTVQKKETLWTFSDVAVKMGKSQLLGDASLMYEQEPHYQFKLQGQDLEAADWAPLLGIKEVNGLFNVKADVEGTGKTWEAFLASGKGRVSIQTHDATVNSVNVAGMLWDKLDSYRTLLPNLAESSPVAEKTTTVKKLALENQLESGVIKTKIVSADFGLLNLKGEGEYNLNTTDLEYTGKLKIDKSFFVDAKKPYDMPFLCQATLREENLSFSEALETNCGMSPEAKREMLSQALKRRFLGSPESASPDSSKK